MKALFYIRSLIIFILLIAFTVPVYSQVLLRVPERIRGVVITNPSQIYHQIADERGTLDWIVFSDRTGNRTKSQPSEGAGNRTSLDYLESFNVIDENDSWVELARLGNSNSIGWIKKEKLILLPHCIQKANRTSYKAMIVNTIETITEDFNFFSVPLDDTKRIAGRGSQVYTIYYIYKQIGDFLLLGEQDAFPSNIERNLPLTIKGWIDKRFVTQWDSRGCVQPNYCSTDRSPALILDTNDICAGVNAPQIWARDQVTNKKWHGSMFRLPYLGKKTGIITQDQNNCEVNNIMLGRLGDITDDKGIRITAIIDSLREAFSKSPKNIMNVVFVIDGTMSMREYFNPVVDAINNGVRELNRNPQIIDPKNPTGIKLNWGAVVYRDSFHDSYAIEEQNIVSDYSQVSDFLTNVYDPNKDRGDPDLPEAMYYGLWYALEYIIGHEREDETNIIVLIGDAGDHERTDDWTSVTDAGQPILPELINLIDTLNCNLLAFQTDYKICDSLNQNCKDTTYRDFKNQITQLIERSNQQNLLRRSGIASDSKTHDDTDNNIVSFSEKSSLVHKLIYAEPNERMNESYLTENIERIIIDASYGTKMLMEVLHELSYGHKSLEEILDEYGINLPGGDFTADIATITREILEMLRKVYPDMSINEIIEEGILEKVLSEKNQFYKEGFSFIQPSNSNGDWWAFDVMVTVDELEQFTRELDLIESMFRGVSENTLRNRLHDVFERLALIYSGDQTVNPDDLTICELFQMIIDSPITELGTCSRICNLTVGDILDPTQCNTIPRNNDLPNLTEFRREVRNSYHELQKIKSIYPFEEYGTRGFKTFSVYWIPVYYFTCSSYDCN
ncbi:MAG: hypothetical protein KAT48_11890 [Bacteroidales bacterium]|nr:hypothetical protein [Bacteroidales bacterium]